MHFFHRLNKNGFNLQVTTSKTQRLTKKPHGVSGVLCLRRLFKSTCFILLLLNRFMSYMNTFVH